MSEQGFGDTLQFSRYALYLQRKGFDDLLCQPALAPLLRDSGVLRQVETRWRADAGQDGTDMATTTDLLPIAISQLWALSEGYIHIVKSMFNVGATC